MMAVLFALIIPELFRLVLAMTLTATLVALAVTLLRLFLKKLGVPQLVIFLLWAVVFFRMVCPVSFTNSMSLLALLPQAAAEAPAATASPFSQESPATPPAFPEVDSSPILPPNTVITVTTPDISYLPTINWFSILAILWAAGTTALCLHTLISYLRLKSRVRAAVRTEDGAWETDQIDGPFVLGFFPPKIYLPLGLSGATRDYVLLHERTHIRRGDHFIKAISFLTLALHWFNPVLWLSWVLACRDMEAACDESVLRSSGEDIRQSYSSALLSLASVRPIRTPLAFGENDVKCRIKGVLKYQRPVVAMVLCSALLVTAAGFALAANPMPLPQTPGTLSVQRNPLTNDTMTASTLGDGPLSYNYTGSVEFWLSGEAPDELTVTECIITDSGYSEPHRAQINRFAGTAGHYGVKIENHPASTGTGVEERLFEVQTRWNSGVNHLDAVYYFRLLVPARGPNGTLSAPIAFAGGQVLPLYESDDFANLPAESSVTAHTGSYIEVAHPGGIVKEELAIYSLIDGSFITGGSSEAGNASPDTKLSFGGGASLLPEEAGPVGVRLTYTYPDGSQKAWLGLIQLVDDAPPPEAEESTTSPELDTNHFRLRFTGDTNWTDLDALIPVPKSWATDTLAGRDRAKNMVGMLDSALGQMGFLTPTDGWLAFCLATNLGPVDDTYFYRTFDGGHTWEEYSHFTARDISEDINWFGVSCGGFSDGDHGYLAMGLFGDAPVLRTTDGGRTWEPLPLPLPDGNWVCSDIWAGDPRLTFADPDGNTCTVYSVNGGDSWQLSMPIDDPEQIPSDQLPWPVYLGAEQEFFPDINNWFYDPIKLLGFSADRTAAVFAFDEGMTGLGGLLLCHGGRLNYFPDLAWSASPRMTSANPVWGDFDGDGAMELAVIPCVGTGTGVSMWDLYIFEQVGKNLVLGGSIRAYDLRDLGSPDLERAGLPENARVGSNIYFEAENGGLRASIGIEDANGIPSVSYIGALECVVDYNGRSLTFKNFIYTENPS